MDGSTGPPSDMAAMGSENDEGSKPQRDNDHHSTQPESEYCGQSSIRAGSASPLPTTTASSSSLSSLSAQSGCGCVAAAAVAVLEPDEITISITPTTGGQFELTVDRTDTVENLKKIISKRLKVAKERICLLHRERLLREGTLEENRLQDGSQLTLLPSVETGLLAQRPEQSVMQALESLNDSQVNDFLSGKAPLNLTMRLGDHMMLIQLQLSTVTASSLTANQNTSNNSGLTIGGNSSNGSNLPSSHVSTSLQSRRSTVLAARSTSSTSSKLQNGTAAARTSSLISSLVSALTAAASCSTSLSTATTTTSPVCSSRATTASSVSSTSSYSPISPPHSSFCNSQSQTARTGNNHGSVSPNGTSSTCQSCLLYHHHHHHHHNLYHHHHHHHHHHHSRNKSSGSSNTTQSSTSNSNSVDHLQQSTSTSHGCIDSVPYDITPPRKKLCTVHHHSQQSTNSDTSRSNTIDGDSSPQSPTSWLAEQKAATLDTRALAEASRNLTQKLKQLSSEESARHRQGAIIESMHHHGKGVYSGTFSGTLNPALQDKHGRPKRDISTIIYILNDLLCSTPSFTARRNMHHHRHSSGRQQSSASPSSTGTTTTVNGASTPISCHDSSNPGYSTKELSKENEATKGKMRRLRLVMEQRRAKRKARRQARAAPYTRQWAAVTPDPDPNHDPNTPSTAATNTTEPQNEPELQPCSPEPVVA
ncbi:PREDICTED: midnolin-A-like isoform X2 [Habropoda laboriosa]|uniref:midnolin-A-like isoform X2 n=1 Tax=Habropoda laboriosa TaxID=597456 RepID=UPI00083D7848|nr:PREDICTED: midnolin-A-like isoform X2 [Habropoda laboriosa]